jgi:hypothetical protein
MKDVMGHYPAVSAPARAAYCLRAEPRHPRSGAGPGAVLVSRGRELVGAHRAFLQRLFAVALEHEVGGTPDIDFGYHAEKSAGLRSRNA